MSRIGKLPIQIPKDVDVNYNGSDIRVKGNFGTLETVIPTKPLFYNMLRHRYTCITSQLIS